MKTQNIRGAIFATLAPHYPNDRLNEALSAALNATGTDLWWNWEVGITGSIHHASGSAATEEAAEEISTRAYAAILAKNPVLGDLPTRVSEETNGQRYKRLESAVLEALNS